MDTARKRFSWSLACDLDSTIMSRQEAFDEILTWPFKSQYLIAGDETAGLFTATMVCGFIGLLLVAPMICSSAYKRTADHT